MSAAKGTLHLPLLKLAPNTCSTGISTGAYITGEAVGVAVGVAVAVALLGGLGALVFLRIIGLLGGLGLLGLLTVVGGERLELVWQQATRRPNQP
jgi:hypothetical protein